MLPSSSVRAATEQAVTRFITARRSEASVYGSDAPVLLDAAEAASSGGKRMRALFAHAGWSAVAQTNAAAAEPDALWQLCAALEFFQAAALVHDDLIDNSDTRRGNPAAHRALAAAHEARRWVGDADAFGRSAAILLGDLLVAWSDDQVEEALSAHPHAAAVRALYAQMRRDVTVGQFLDIAEESAWALVPDADHAERALRVIHFKSARYSVEHPILLGAALAGARAAQHAALSAFARPVGVAFQLRDDVLGVFGDPAVTGKPAGDDLREGKRTVLVALTRVAVGSGARATLDELLGDPDLSPGQIASIQSTIRDSGALAEVEARISDAVREAERALSGAPLANAAVGSLRELARAATDRRA